MATAVGAVMMMLSLLSSKRDGTILLSLNTFQTFEIF
jgi:hypothetical protein